MQHEKASQVDQRKVENSHLDLICSTDSVGKADTAECSVFVNFNVKPNSSSSYLGPQMALPAVYFSWSSFYDKSWHDSQVPIPIRPRPNKMEHLQNCKVLPELCYLTSFFNSSQRFRAWMQSILLKLLKLYILNNYKLFEKLLQGISLILSDIYP